MPLVWGRVDPTLLHPVFRVDAATLLEGSRWTWYVTSGYRSLVEQAVLRERYEAGGPRAAPPGQSAHNYGLAIDVVPDVHPDKPGLQPSWDVRFAAWVWLKAATLAHPRLQNGWSFGDWPHIQRYRWRQHRHWRPIGALDQQVV